MLYYIRKYCLGDDIYYGPLDTLSKAKFILKQLRNKTTNRLYRYKIEQRKELL